MCDSDIIYHITYGIKGCLVVCDRQGSNRLALTVWTESTSQWQTGSCCKNHSTNKNFMPCILNTNWPMAALMSKQHCSVTNYMSEWTWKGFTDASVFTLYIFLHAYLHKHRYYTETAPIRTVTVTEPAAAHQWLGTPATCTANDT